MRMSTEHREYIDNIAREFGTSSADVVRTMIDAHIGYTKKELAKQEGAKYSA